MRCRLVFTRKASFVAQGSLQILKYYNLPVTIVTTKFDKVNRALRDKQNDIIKKTLTPALGDEIINFSSVTKLGKERVYDIIENYFEKQLKKNSLFIIMLIEQRKRQYE